MAVEQENIPRLALEVVQGMLLDEAARVKDENHDYAAGLERASNKITLELGTTPNLNPYREGSSS